MPDRICGRILFHPDFLAVELQRTANQVSVGLAEDAHRQLRTAGSHQPVDPDHFSFTDIHGYIADHQTLRIERVLYGPAADFHIDIADLYTFPLRETVRDLTADHSLDDPVFVDVVVRIVDRLNRRSVADDRDLVGHIRDLVELMGNDNHRHALLFEAEHEIKQRFRVLFIQGRSRLVEDEKPCVLRKRFGDLNQLLLSGTDLLDQHLRGFGQTNHLEVFVRLDKCSIPVDFGFSAALIAEIHVLADRHFRNQCQLLVDNDDSFAFRIFYRIKFTGLAVIDNIAFIGPVRINTAENIHQRGFTGAILTDKCVDLTFFHLEIDIVESLDTRKCFDDILHLQKYLSQTVILPQIMWIISPEDISPDT